MDTLDGTEWDVVISGTGLRQSLLVLSLSRSGKKILHVDRNDYYGGYEAALSLTEADRWAKEHSVASQLAKSASHSHAVIENDSNDVDGGPKLSFPRAYALALAPHLIHSRSSLLPALVSSKVHNQLEFQALGSWFVVDPQDGAQARLVRVPNGREDIFQESSFDLRAKRSLMKFIRFVGDYEAQWDKWQEEKETPFQEFLQRRFGLPPVLHAPIMALSLSPAAPDHTTTETALPYIARHLHSIGMFGPGFGAVLPKWGGLSEVAQVACRAGAVGGGVYVLNMGIKSIHQSTDGPITLELSEGDKVTTKTLVGSADDLNISTELDRSTICSRSINIVSSTLSILFPPTSEGGVTPAGAVIAVPSKTSDAPPVYIFAHSSESGECPAGQCVLYASVALHHDQGFKHLDAAVQAFLHTLPEDESRKILWTMRYEQCGIVPLEQNPSDTIVMNGSIQGLALEESVLEEVRSAWHSITGEDDDGFLKFEARDGTEEDEI